MNRVCVKCNLEQDISQYYGRYNTCKTCKIKYSIEYRNKNRDRVNELARIRNNKPEKREYLRQYTRQWLKDNPNHDPHKWIKNNPDKVKINRKEYWINNKDALKVKNKEYRETNKEKIKKQRSERKEEIKKIAKIYYNRTRDKRNLNRRKYIKNRLDTNLSFKIEKYLRSRLYTSLKYKGIKKSKSLNDLLGCDYMYLRDYLESKFLPTMTWENYGKYWHIDHIIPCAKFDLTKEEEQRKCFHYTNLQPLFAVNQTINGITYIGNMNKGDKLI